MTKTKKMAKTVTKTNKIYVMRGQRQAIVGSGGLLSQRNLAQASNSQQRLDLDLGFWIWLFM